MEHDDHSSSTLLERGLQQLRAPLEQTDDTFRHGLRAQLAEQAARPQRTRRVHRRRPDRLAAEDS